MKGGISGVVGGVRVSIVSEKNLSTGEIVTEDGEVKRGGFVFQISDLVYIFSCFY